MGQLLFVSAQCASARGGEDLPELWAWRRPPEHGSDRYGHAAGLWRQERTHPPAGQQQRHQRTAAAGTAPHAYKSWVWQTGAFAHFLPLIWIHDTHPLLLNDGGSKEKQPSLQKRQRKSWQEQTSCDVTFVFCPQTHPNVDKKLFTSDSVIGLKNPEKSFPLNNDVGVLKWRLQTTDEALIPLTSTSRDILCFRTCQIVLNTSVPVQDSLLWTSRVCLLTGNLTFLIFVLKGLYPMNFLSLSWKEIPNPVFWSFHAFLSTVFSRP